MDPCNLQPTEFYMALLCKSFIFNPFQENTYVLYTESGKCVVIDPGCYGPAEQLELEQFFDTHNLVPEAVWLTHTHVDHILGLAWMVRKWNIPFFMHKNEISQLKAVEVYAPNYGFYDFEPVEPQFYLDEQTGINLAEYHFQVLFVPGHAPGHVAFYQPETGQIWAGDVLFKRSIGRTDLPGGNHTQLENSIRNALYHLPDLVKVYPGHGEATTIGEEKRFNPFVRP